MPFNLVPEDSGDGDEVDDAGNDDVDLDDNEQNIEENGPDDNHVENMRPGTRAELNRLKARFQNTMKLVGHLFHDRELQSDLCMVGAASHWYMHEYSASLEQMRKGKDGIDSKKVFEYLPL